MASETVANSPIGTYQVEVDRTATGSERQAVGIDIGTVTNDVLVPSRVSASNPLPITGTVTASGSVTVTNGAGASAVNIQDGGNSITVDGTVSITANSAVNIAQYGGMNTSLGKKSHALSVPVVLSCTQPDGFAQPEDVLPMGIYSSGASQWVAWDGNVAVNNGSGASAVNIQDGGNSITVDGTVAATQSGTWNINNVSGTVSLPTGAATAALQTTGNNWLSNISNNTDNFNATFQLDSRSSATAVLSVGFDGSSSFNALDVDSNGAGLTRQSGTWSVRNQDGSGNSLTSTTGAPGASDRGLTTRSIAYNYDSGGGTQFRQEGNSLYGTAYFTEKSATGVTKSFGNGTSGTGVQRVTIASDSTGVIIANGGVAHDSADSGNPVKIGGKALTADPTAVATGDRVNALFDKLGKQVVLPNALLEKHGKATSASSITNTTSTSLVAATASVIRVITAITVSNMHASVATIVNILDGTTVVWHGPAAALGGGYSISGLHLVGTVNTAINVQCVTSGASVRASVEYFEIAG